MGASAGLGMAAGSSMISASNQADAIKNQANFSATQYAENQKISAVQASGAIQQGDVAADLAGEKGRQEIGQQRATEAANGIDVNSGSAAQLQADTAGQTAINVQTIKNNAWRAAWGFQIQGANEGAQSQFTSIAGNYNASTTMLTGGMNAAAFGLKGYGVYQNNNDGSDDDISLDGQTTGGPSAGNSYADFSNVV